MLITKDMVGKTVYCLGSQPHRNYHPAKLERVVTKVGRKYIYIDGEQYEPRSDLSTGEFTYLYGSFGSSVTVFNSKQLYDAHNERTELQKKLVDFSKDRLGIYNIPLDDLKLVAKLLNI
ncbi:beta barrel domain-containing protein [Photobacterium leiognathi]|uniref:beta barrel domain-containing protein n=1 Tax=Photobacterium leiognathi TaxID=553611 RepID=UPI0029828AE1|nr:hypothetical protein [Photobacterium leiognathi]